jgi:tRNA splicing ligase
MFLTVIRVWSARLFKYQPRLISTMAPTFYPEDSDLIHRLTRLSDKSPKLVKRSDYAAPAAPETTIRSWRMSEFRYYEIPSPFPTLARGLFSTELKENGQQFTGDKIRYRIVIRGYDKFFNIGEVPWTTVCDHLIWYSTIFFDRCSPSVGFIREAHVRPLHSFFEI